jgi:putative spermidine/putrescine transport system ATP-binding protein
MATLSLQSVTRRFGAVAAVDDLSLEVAAGEFICLLGPSGCGKSTALRLVGGFEEPDGGDILIDGVSTVGVPPNRRATSMVFQSHALWSHMTAFGNVAFGLKLRRLPSATVRRKVDDALSLLGLSGMEKRYPRQLSGGQQQRVALARSLVLEPKILLLDEPFSALDAHLRVRLREELRVIQRRLAQTTVFVTHDQEEALTLADRIVIMNRGRIEQIGTPAMVYDHPETIFVADFVGAMNRMPARPDAGGLAAGPWRVALKGQEAAAFDGTDVLDLAIRPEDIELVETDGTVDATGRIEQVIDLGPMRQVQIDCGGNRLKVQVPRQIPVRAGEGVGLRLHRALVYRQGASPVEIRPHDDGFGTVLRFRRTHPLESVLAQ